MENAEITLTDVRVPEANRLQDAGIFKDEHSSLAKAFVTACSRVLNVSADALYGPPQDPLRVAHEWLVADTPVSVHRIAICVPLGTRGTVPGHHDTFVMSGHGRR